MLLRFIEWIWKAFVQLSYHAWAVSVSTVPWSELRAAAYVGRRGRMDEAGALFASPM